jgi:micrococcal nuclease
MYNKIRFSSYLYLFIIFIIVCTSLSLFLFFRSAISVGRAETAGAMPTFPEAACYEAEVVRVIDGDTIVVSFGGGSTADETVRLIGIDAPESVHPDESLNSEQGTVSSEYTRSFLLGKKVYLEYDTTECDKYERLLAYVWVDESPNGKILYNYKMVKDGYAYAKSYPPDDKYKEKLAGAEKYAITEHLGLWR